jgi:hypothetical protein
MFAINGWPIYELAILIGVALMVLMPVADASMTRHPAPNARARLGRRS